MAFTPSHRPTASASNNLNPPSTPLNKQQRRMTSPGSLNLPEGGQRAQNNRPPSPLRNGFTSTGIDHDVDDSDDEQGWQRSPSPSSSVSQLAANFAQRVGAFVNTNVNARPSRPSSTLPSDAELEAEAEREREKSRREAERIMREAEDRKNVEDRVLAMLQSNRASDLSLSVRSQTTPNPPSPATSQKEKDSPSWWKAAKERLTPTKEPLTPAQQVIQDTKAREKERKSLKGKDKDRSGEWPSSAEKKYSETGLLNLNVPVTPNNRPPAPSSPSSPTPLRPNSSNLPPNLTPSPMRSFDKGSSPSREAPPLYVQFNPQGTLDVPGTLLTIAKRFEKLEKWTVGHVRALEDRMSDVERWLVDKEKEKEETKPRVVPVPVASAPLPTPPQGKFAPADDVERMKEDLAELQSRVSELGREIARSITAPQNLSSNSSKQPVQVSTAPQTSSSFAEPTTSDIEDKLEEAFFAGSPPPAPHQRILSGPMDSTSPPIASARTSSRARLPYPSGDYAPTLESSLQGHASPTSSPPSSITSATRNSKSISGLPPLGLGVTTSPRSLPVAQSTPPLNPSSSNSSLRLPKPSTSRNNSASPTPRKRYTVALGEPIVPPPDDDHEALRPPRTPLNRHRRQDSISTAYFSSSGGEEDDDNVFQDNSETIGKSTGRKVGGTHPPIDLSPPAPAMPNDTRTRRAQSVYGYNTLQPPQAPITPLRPSRSRSSDKLGGEGKFIDPLVLRRQEQASKNIAMPKPIGKVPVGKLVAFFDQDQK